MHKVIITFEIVLLILLCLAFGKPTDAKMFREVVIGVFTDAPSMAECDRYYMRYHGPEVARQSGPWMTRYQLWLPYEPPEEAVEHFGAVRGRYAELWYKEEDYLERPVLKGITLPSWFETTERENKSALVIVPAIPTEEFFDTDPSPEESSILRWVTMFKYPEGVSIEDGEKWFLETHVKEALKQPGLLKFVSYRAATPKDGSLKYVTDIEDVDTDTPHRVQSGQPYVRLCEYWYSDMESWQKAVIETPPSYTAPSWGGEYPFVDMRSTFLPYFHDVDFLKGTYQINFDNPNIKYNVSP